MDEVSNALNDAVSRTVGILGLAGIALIHALQAPEAFEETTYLGVLFVGAIVASLALAAALTRTSDRRAWGAAGGLAASIMLGYLLTRTSGLPDATVDIGNWTEPLGLASLVAEGLVLFVAGGVVAREHSPTLVPLGDH
jgi:membrane protease YdiL (CAAX protease family)